MLVFKPGRLLAVWDAFQRRLPLCPRNVWRRTLADGTQQAYGWVHDLSYTDSAGRSWRFHALPCLETSPGGAVTRFAWITPLPVSVRNVAEIAQKGGRYRWKIENEGFKRQKNSGLKLAHVYSIDPEKAKAYYYLLQIAFIIAQLLERGCLLRQRVAGLGQKVCAVFGSLANIAQQLREALKYCWWPDDYCAGAAAAPRPGFVVARAAGATLRVSSATVTGTAVSREPRLGKRRGGAQSAGPCPRLTPPPSESLTPVPWVDHVLGEQTTRKPMLKPR